MFLPFTLNAVADADNATMVEGIVFAMADLEKHPTSHNFTLLPSLITSCLVVSVLCTASLHEIGVINFEIGLLP